MHTGDPQWNLLVRGSTNMLIEYLPVLILADEPRGEAASLNINVFWYPETFRSLNEM